MSLGRATALIRPHALLLAAGAAFAAIAGRLLPGTMLPLALFAGSGALLALALAGWASGLRPRR